MGSGVGFGYSAWSLMGSGVGFGHSAGSFTSRVRSVYPFVMARVSMLMRSCRSCEPFTVAIQGGKFRRQVQAASSKAVDSQAVSFTGGKSRAAIHTRSLLAWSVLCLLYTSDAADDM
eukprot:6695357-Prymnesium_polylepis.1